MLATFWGNSYFRLQANSTQKLYNTFQNYSAEINAKKGFASHSVYFNPF